MRIRVLVALTALMIPVALLAQNNEVAVFVNHPTFHSTGENDSSLGMTFKLKFDPKAGYGVSFNHFFSQNLSTELQARILRGNSKVEVSGGDFPTTSVDAGTLELNQYAALLQWHFGTSTARLRPHVGVGIARIQGAKMKIPAELTNGTGPETVSLDDKTTWTAAAGLDIPVYRNAAIALTSQYTPYTTRRADPTDPVQELTLNPLTYGAGIRWRF